MVDAVNGEGRIGRDGFVSELNVLIKDRASGILAVFDLLANVVPPATLWRRMVGCDKVYVKGQRLLRSIRSVERAPKTR
jgi:predicted transcriptional regulator